jgi:hypothetical protein
MGRELQLAGNESSRWWAVAAAKLRRDHCDVISGRSWELKTFEPQGAGRPVSPTAVTDPLNLSGRS